MSKTFDTQTLFINLPGIQHFREHKLFWVLEKNQAMEVMWKNVLASFCSLI